MRSQCLLTLWVGVTLAAVCGAQDRDTPHPKQSIVDRRERIEFVSTLDGSLQPAYLIAPQQTTTGEKIPLIVSLHSWSADLQQRNPSLESLAYERGWYYLFPNFRGANKTPAALGSKLAQQDILDSLEWVCKHRDIDTNNIFLTGNSGGGHMTMLMSARYPERWTAASAWVGISDLVAWHQKHQGSKYGNMMESACGGAPGDSVVVDREYRERSPKTFLANAKAKAVAIDIAAGVHDGHRGSVPVRHSIEAFNCIAVSNGTPAVSESEIDQISRAGGGRLDAPEPSDVGFDESFGRKFYLRRTSSRARLTIFEGGHEGIATAAMAWFESHLK